MNLPAITDTTSPDAASASAVGRMCRRHAQSLYIASFFLPPRKRLAVQAVGGFVHMLQEALDVDPNPAAAGSCSSAGDLQQRLAMVQDRLGAIYSGQICPPDQSPEPSTAIIYVLSRAIERFQIPRDYFDNLTASLRTRATTLRFATWSSLAHYCRQRGGSIALIINAILGTTRSDTHESASDLGAAIEVTRILRDLKKDAGANRIYLPLEDLARFRYPERDLKAGVINGRFISLIQFQIDRARQLYRRGADAIPWLGGDGSRLCAATLAVLYSGLLRQIERVGYDVFKHPVKLNPAQRLRRMADAWRLARRRAGDDPIGGWEMR